MMTFVVAMDNIDQVKGRLLDEFESGRAPDIADYVRRFPEYRQELLDFWVVLASSDRLSDVEREDADRSPLTDREEEIVRDLCLAVSLGPAWLEHAVDEEERNAAAVGAELLRIRGTPYEYVGKANRNWQRISVYAWLAQRATASRGIVSSLELQKLAYLLEEGMSLGIFTTHKKHRLGPYDPTVRYKDAVPQCVQKGYLVRVGKWDFQLGPNIDEALKYAGRYLREESVADAFLQVLLDLELDKWHLETLATVHSVARNLAAEGVEVTAETVQTALAADKTWSTKLGKSNFTSARIAQALETLTLLRLLE